MSAEPRPQSTSPSMRGVALPFAGTVSVWPASTTRVPRPRSVRATTLSPTRVTSRCASERSSSSMTWVIRCSSKLSEAMPTSAGGPLEQIGVVRESATVRDVDTHAEAGRMHQS